MSIAIVLGYSGMKRGNDVSNLYTGCDVAKAREILNHPPEGYARTELLINPTPSLRRIHEGKVEEALNPKHEIRNEEAEPEVAVPVEAEPAKKKGRSAKGESGGSD